MRGSGRTEELTKTRVKDTSYGVNCSLALTGIRHVERSKMRT